MSTHDTAGVAGELKALGWATDAEERAAAADGGRRLLRREHRLLTWALQRMRCHPLVPVRSTASSAHTKASFPLWGLTPRHAAGGRVQALSKWREAGAERRVALLWAVRLRPKS